MLHKWPSVKLIEGENPWVTYAKKRVYKDNNCINLICTGGPGTGKSWGLLSYFCSIDPDFDVNEQCFFKAKKLIRCFQFSKNLKGKPFMFDEAGIDASSLNWQDEVNKGLKAFFQTARHRNYIFGMTVPFMSFVSKGVRTLMTVHWKAQGWTSKNQTKIAPYVLEYNGDYDKFYWKRLLVKVRVGLDYCNEIRLPRPPKEKEREYEKMKQEFTQNLFKTIADKIEAKEEVNEKKGMVKCTDLARKLGIGTETMLGWIHQKRLDARKICGCWFVTEKEEESFLEGKKARRWGI